MAGKLGNPGAIVGAQLASDFAKSDQGKKTISQGVTALKVIVIGAGIFVLGRLGLQQLKKIRRNNFLNNNGTKPATIAAIVFHNSMFTTTFDILGFDFSIPDGTDEDALNNLALQIQNIDEVSNAYKIIFDRNLILDIQNELNVSELIAFFNRLQADGDFDPGDSTPVDDIVPFLIGQDIYVKNPNGLDLEEVDSDNNPTGEFGGAYVFGEKIGEIEDVIIDLDSNVIYYIVDPSILPFSTNVIVDHRQVTNRDPNE
ncbi:MAG: hypothetical protein HRT68_10215 [Flavobacteriaceae bacterium]|nr:hypothetical protein [Flavobacteriaceae bacterium]